MKLLRPLLLVTALLALGACTTTSNPLDVFRTVSNPISSVDIYRVKNTYAATLQLAKDWRAYCWSKPYSAIVVDPIMKPVCQSRRATVRQIQKYQPIAGTAVRKADEFVKNNPTVNAAGAIGLAWDAVTALQNVIPKIN